MTDFKRSRPGMTIKTGTELQALRKAAAERFTAIAVQYVPEGYTIEYSKNRAHCDLNRRVIRTPKPVTRKALHIFLHECAHAHLHEGRRNPRHVEEMQAEKWADEKMREHGVSVPRSTTKLGKRYVARKIRLALARGAKRIDPAGTALRQIAR